MVIPGEIIGTAGLMDAEAQLLPPPLDFPDQLRSSQP